RGARHPGRPAPQRAVPGPRPRADGRPRPVGHSPGRQRADVAVDLRRQGGCPERPPREPPPLARLPGLAVEPDRPPPGPGAGARLERAPTGGHPAAGRAPDDPGRAVRRRSRGRLGVLAALPPRDGPLAGPAPPRRARPPDHARDPRLRRPLRTDPPLSP